MILGILDSAAQQGFLYAIAVFGIVISFRIMNFPDLTVDGSFTLGGAVLASLIVVGYSPYFAMPIAGIAGFGAGCITVFLNRKLGISKILSGILVMLILYSINLRIMGKANISLLRIDNLFSSTLFQGTGNLIKISLFFSISLFFILILFYLISTRFGLFLRATGDNEFMVRTLGINTNWQYYIGIGLANCLVALSGAFVVQNQGFADINMGIGLIITALAALIIGESIFSIIKGIKRRLLKGKSNNLSTKTKKRLLPWESYGEFTAALFGAFLYFLIISICLRLGLAPTDLKLATGVLVILGIALRFKGPIVESYVRGRF